MKVAVFGAGTMGLGIIQVFAEKGNTVLVYDISMDFVRNQVQKLEASLAKRVAKGKMKQEEAGSILSKIQTSLLVPAQTHLLKCILSL